MRRSTHFIVATRRNLPLIFLIILFFITYFQKKIAQIEDLKQRQSGGEKLEKNQLDKMYMEDDLLEELEKLDI